MFRPLTASCLLVVALTAATYAADTPSSDVLEIKVEHVPGKEVLHRTQTKTVGTMQFAPGMPAQKFSQMYEMDIRTRCLKAPEDGSGVYEITMPRIAMEMQIGGLINMSYASDKGISEASEDRGARIVKAIFDAMTQVKFQATIGPDNQPREVKGLSEGIAKILDASLGDSVPPQQRQFFEQLSNFLNDEQMKEYFKSTGRMLPDRKIRPGDTWVESWEMVLPIFKQPLTGRAEYTFTGLKEKQGRTCARITNNMSIQQDDDNAMTMDAPGGVKLRMKFNINSGMGEAYLDTETWDIIELREVQDMTINITVTEPPQGESAEPKQTSMEQKLKQTTKTWLVEETTTPDTTTQPAG